MPQLKKDVDRYVPIVMNRTHFAGVMELVDMGGLNPPARKGVRVRVASPVPNKIICDSVWP